MERRQQRNAAFDTIVVGCGGMGSAATYQLALRGKTTLALERFDIPHVFGSSHGINRIIRLAYYEHPSYVPLLRRAFDLWRQLEQVSGETLFVQTGSIDASEPDGQILRGSVASCELHGIDYELLSAAQVANRYPGYQLPSSHVALFQNQGGFVLSERAIVNHVLQARKHGAEIHAREHVLEWQEQPWGVTVTTDRGTYDAETLVLTAGPWMGKLAPDLRSLLQPERQVLVWFNPNEPTLFQPERFPVFNLGVGEDHFYGFPEYGIPGFKMGKYHHLEQSIDPDMPNPEPTPEDEQLIRTAVSRYFPAANGPVMSTASCIFTNSPDEHFIIDSLAKGSVVIVSPCSGHGFKFAPVVGEIAADLAANGSTEHDISLFSLERFADYQG